MSDMRIERRVHRKDGGVLNIDIEYKVWEQDTPNSILVSRNGYQWSGFALQSKEEIIGLRDALNEYIWMWGFE